MPHADTVLPDLQTVGSAIGDELARRGELVVEFPELPDHGRELLESLGVTVVITPRDFDSKDCVAAGCTEVALPGCDTCRGHIGQRAATPIRKEAQMYQCIEPGCSEEAKSNRGRYCRCEEHRTQKEGTSKMNVVREVEPLKPSRVIEVQFPASIIEKATRVRDAAQAAIGAFAELTDAITDFNES